MDYCIEFFAGDVHDFIFLNAWSLDDAEDIAAARLRDAFGENFAVVGSRGVSATCLWR